MRSTLKRIANLIRRWFSGAGELADRIVRGIDAALPYIAVAYQYVELAARLTPTRSDDELLRLARELGVPEFLESEDRAIALATIVLRALQRRYPGVPDRVLRRAIEIAYGALRP